MTTRRERSEAPTFAENQAAERMRIVDLLARDQIEAHADQLRDQAVIEVSDGQFVNITDTVLPPTPEWLAKGETMPFTPSLDGDRVRHVRTVTSVRRVLTPIVVRMHRAGKITDAQAAACIWYNRQFEESGLRGKYGSARPSLTSGTSSSRESGFSGHMPMHEAEAIARHNYRDARGAIFTDLIDMFEAVVLENVPLRRAKAYMRCRHGHEIRRFRTAAQMLAEHCDERGFDLSERES